MAEIHSTQKEREKAPHHALAKDILNELANQIGEIPGIAARIIETEMIPLHYVPWMFCGCAGDHNRCPTDGKSTGRCLIKWGVEIARAIIETEIAPRDRDSWMVIWEDDQINAQSLIPWRELEQWASANHGLSSGYGMAHRLTAVVEEQQAPASRQDERELTKGERQERAVLATIRAKGWEPMSVPDGEKGTVKALCEAEYPKLFAATSFETTWKRGINKLWRMQSHVSYAKRGRE